MASGVEAIAADAIDLLPAGEPVEFMTTIARPFPVAVIAEWLALDPATTRLLWDRADELVRLLDGVIGAGADGRDTRGDERPCRGVPPLAASRRETPGDDLLSLLAADRELALDEVVANAVLLAIAGHETTAGLLGNALVRLLAGADGTRLADRIGAVTPADVDEFSVRRTATGGRADVDRGPLSGRPIHHGRGAGGRGRRCGESGPRRLRAPG